MEIPQFISKELLEKALQQFLCNKDVNIVECKSKWAVPPGDNFTSDLLRSTITYSLNTNGDRKTLSVLIKTFPEVKGPLLQDTVKHMKLFPKEIEFYKRILPEVHRILGNSETLAPRCLYAEEHPVPCLIIEDLSPLGYKMLDRKKGLNLEHCLLVMKRIAQLHAASLQIYKQDPKAFLNYHECLYSGQPFSVHWLNISIECIQKACEERPGMAKYVQKLERIKGDFIEKCKEIAAPIPGGFNVLNHEDCWTNNFLFLYDDDGKLVDLKLIDFQLMAYSGPSIDLHYFWSTTPKLSVRREHFDTVVDYYFNELERTLININYPREQLPLREEIYDDFRLRVYVGFATSITTFPVIKSDIRNDSPLDELLSPVEKYEGSYREHVFTNPRFWKHFEYVLPFLEKFGLFD